MQPGIDGFEYNSVPIGPTEYSVGTAGTGSPVLLLHGFPQTHYCWDRVAPTLVARHTVVVCDLKGYGASRAEPGGPLGEGYSKREMAAELVDVMSHLGHSRFAVVGHDRGGRVAYRMALDHPDVVDALCVLNIIPTVEQFERLTPDFWPFLLLAQPPPVAERLIAPVAEHVVREILATWPASPDAIPADAVERYVEAFTPEAIACICAEYRAAFHLDRPMDEEDRRADRRIRCPVLVHWEAEEASASRGPLEVWGRWADAVQGGPIVCGHFIPEEAPEALADSLVPFLTS